MIVELNNRRCELSHDKKIKIKIRRHKEEGRETSLKSEANREGNERRLLSYNERRITILNRSISNPVNDGKVE